MTNQKGFVLPLVIVFSFIMMSSLAIWYRQVVVQSFLSEQLLLQHSLYKECQSLLPVLKEKLDTLESSELTIAQPSFFTLEDNGKMIWTIDRSPWEDELIVLTFREQSEMGKSVLLPIHYKR